MPLKNRKVIDDIVASGTPVYGVNTGVGSQKDHTVAPEDIAAYNRALVRAHGTRVPGPIAESVTIRATLILMINEHSHGLSGLSPALLELLVEKVNEDPMPQIDASGSVGASDLVPLAQLADWVLSDPRAAVAGLPAAKDALSLINCNAFALATLCLCLDELKNLMEAFTHAAALSLEGLRGNLDAMSSAVAQATSRGGQHHMAERLAVLFADSALHQKGANRFLQDPLSFRNVTQVLGAVQECLGWLEQVVADEMQSTAVNPLVLENGRTALSHGNMDTTRLTLAIDMMRQALGKSADMAGERVQKQQWPAFSGLPIGLAKDHAPMGGVQFLNLGHITASLVTSVKIWSAPSLLHSVGQVADGVEDTSSNAVHASFDLSRQIDACFKIAIIEAIVAIWAIERRGLTADDLGRGLRPLYQALLETLPLASEGEHVFDLANSLKIFRESL
ncbi:MAG: aromatic amino acid lyase [Pseudoruegeria sp.]